MDSNHRDFDSLESPKVVMMEEESERDDESQALLASKEGGLSTVSEKPKRKVQWLDKYGDKLAEIVEFEPSEPSDSEEEDSDACMCTIM